MRSPRPKSAPPGWRRSCAPPPAVPPSWGRSASWRRAVRLGTERELAVARPSPVLKQEAVARWLPAAARVAAARPGAGCTRRGVRRAARGALETSRARGGPRARRRPRSRAASLPRPLLRRPPPCRARGGRAWTPRAWLAGWRRTLRERPPYKHVRRGRDGAKRADSERIFRLLPFGGVHCPSVFVCVAHLSLEMTALYIYLYSLAQP